MASGMRLVADAGCAEAGEGIDTLLVSGGLSEAIDRVRGDRECIGWLRDRAARVRRIGSVCTGALLLAEAGLLNGRQATTHWMDVAELSRRYPATRVIADAIYVHDGAVWTSAGITAGMDLALAMVAADHGMPLALKVAKRMVMVTKRAGGQSQFSPLLDAQQAPDAFAELAAWLRANLRRRIDIDTMAERVHASPRHFRRQFQAVFGVTPQRYLESLRIEAAKALLEHAGHELKRVARDAGFSSEEALRRAFVRRLGVTPSDYRQRFAPLV